MITARTLVLALLLAAGVAGQAPASDDLIWKQYFTWFQDGDPRLNTPQRYRAKLVAEGLSEGLADERMALITKLSAQHQTDFIALGFNHTYTAPVAPFNTQPNAFLVSMTTDLKPGAALDVAMGQGRNALYLATKGLAGDRFRYRRKGPGIGPGGSLEARHPHHHNQE